MPPQSAYAKPLPQPTALTKPFWAHCRQHELWLQCCLDCGKYRFYPTASCPFCASEDTEWRRVSGRGSIYTFTVTNQNQAPGFRESLPYVMAYVDLDEGLKMLTNIVDCPPDQVKIGMPVEVVYEDVTPEVTLAKFRPAR